MMVVTPTDKLINLGNVLIGIIEQVSCYHGIICIFQDTTGRFRACTFTGIQRKRTGDKTQP